MENELKHSIEPNDVLLNLAQLHSARFVQLFQPSSQYPNMEFETLIHRAIQNRHVLEGTESAEGAGLDNQTVARHEPEGSPPASHNPVDTTPEDTQHPVRHSGDPAQMQAESNQAESSGRKRTNTTTARTTDARAKRVRVQDSELTAPRDSHLSANHTFMCCCSTTSRGGGKHVFFPDTQL